jgi:hypothetical protein
MVPVLLPQIDIAAHVGGFMIGALATVVVCRRLESLQRQGDTSVSLHVASIGLAGLFAVGLVQAAVSAQQRVPDNETRVVHAFITGMSARPDALNAMAWAYVTDPNASPDTLDMARMAADRATKLSPDNPQFLDTLATAYFRLGQLEHAVATEHRAISKQDTRFFASQMGRFLAVRQRVAGPLEIGADAIGSRINLTVEPRDQMRDGKRALLFDAGAEYAHGMTVYALATRGNALQGVFRMMLGPNGARRQYRLVPDGAPFLNDWSDDVHFAVALVDASGCGCTSGRWQWRYWSMDREVLKLP